MLASSDMKGPRRTLRASAVSHPCAPSPRALVRCALLNGENSLAVQWLGLSPFPAGALVRSLIRELRSHKPCGVTQKTKQKVELLPLPVGKEPPP